MSLREYIVTANSFEDLDSIYQDMETPGGGFYIPHRAVEVSKRRSISRNTHYMLTDDEAQLVSNDPRVLSVELNYEDSGIVINPFSFATVQTSTQWNKSTTLTQGDVNWGLLRSIEGTNRASWGSGATAQVSGSINMTSLGRHVDVVIADGIMPLGHPEWDSIDDPNTSRYVRHNWYQYNDVLGITGLTGSYPYSDFEAAAYNGNNDHGTHVASTASGYQQGWAKCANIYNIFPYFSAHTYYVLDWIRAFHLLKTVNSITGRKNPTVVNMSYGSIRSVVFQDITEINFQGTTYFKPANGWTETDKGRFGLAWAPGTNKANVICMVRSTAMDVDLEEARQQGIILVCAAGNDNTHCDVDGGVNYNNYIKTSAGTITFYHRGSSQSGISNISDGVVCVGASDATVTERKASFSNTGPRIDVFAPGVNIMGAHRTPKDDMATWPTNTKMTGVDLNVGTFTLGTGSSIISNNNKGTIGNSPNPCPNYPGSSKFGTLGVPIGFFQTRIITKNDKVTIPTTYTHCYLDACKSGDQSYWGGLGDTPDSGEDIVVQYSIDNINWIEFARVGVTSIGVNVWKSILQTQGLPSGIYNPAGVYIRYTQPKQIDIPPAEDDAKWAVGNIYFVKISKITDTRDENYYVNKMNGTSMASPQVAGLLACAAEVLGNMDQTDAHKIISKNSSSNILYTEPWNGGIYPSTSFTSLFGLQGATNLYLKHRYERNLSGALHPKMDYNDQDYNTSPDKIMYPRPRIRRKG